MSVDSSSYKLPTCHPNGVASREAKRGSRRSVEHAELLLLLSVLTEPTAAAAAEAATTEAFFTTWDTVGKKCGILSSNVKTPHMIDYHGYLSNQNVSSFILRVIHMLIYVGI